MTKKKPAMLIFWAFALASFLAAAAFAQDAPPSSAMMRQLDDVVAQSASLNSEVVSMRGIIGRQIEQLQQLTAANASLAKERDDLKAANADLTKKATDLAGQIVTLTKQNDELKSQPSTPGEPKK